MATPAPPGPEPLSCSACGAPVIDAPLPLALAASLTGMPNGRRLAEYIKEKHPEWKPWYRVAAGPDKRRRAYRYVLASQCRAVIAETFRTDYHSGRWSGQRAALRAGQPFRPRKTGRQAPASVPATRVDPDACLDTAG